jgi:hypothetical protein
MSAFGQIYQLYHIHNLVEMLGDLLNLAVVTDGCQGQP